MQRRCCKIYTRVARDDIGHGGVADWGYQESFNMQLIDVNMLRVNNDELPKQKEKKNFNYDRSAYYRSLLVSLSMHRFIDLGREVYFLIIENKTYAAKNNQRKRS